MHKLILKQIKKYKLQYIIFTVLYLLSIILTLLEPIIFGKILDLIINNAGKTTIINLILGFYKLNSGNILLDGKNIDDISLESIRKNVSFIQQNPYIFNDTIKRNIVINDNNIISDEKIMDILKQVGLYDKIKNYNNGIYEKVKYNLFSKGEKQLLAFARAIAKETSIYIFDEPTSNIDVESEIQLKKVIDNLSKYSTVIIIAHRPATIENVDRILKVEDGSVIQLKESL